MALIYNNVFRIDFTLQDKNKECALAHSRAAARLLLQPNYRGRGMRILAERFDSWETKFPMNQKRLKLTLQSLAGEEGFEPPLTVLETVALPLN